MDAEFSWQHGEPGIYRVKKGTGWGAERFVGVKQTRCVLTVH